MKNEEREAWYSTSSKVRRTNRYTSTVVEQSTSYTRTALTPAASRLTQCCVRLVLVRPPFLRCILHAAWCLWLYLWGMASHEGVSLCYATMMQHRGLGLGFDSNSATFFEFRKFEYLNYSNFELKSNFHVLHLRCVR
jgi:hypothetical protein